ncbi:MAG: M56 family metallopeptidase [Nitriliruptorales bacterium]
MPDVFGVLFSLPTESVAVRATVASLAAVVAVSLLLRSFLRVPRVRSLAVVVPVAALLGAVVVSWSELLLPTLMTMSEADDALGPFLFGGTYVSFAPVAWPLIGLWATITSLRVLRRLVSVRRLQRVAAAPSAERDPHLERVTRLVAARLHVPAPRVVVVEGCPGAAALVGIRRPTVIVDSTMLAELDDEELEGLIAHELAHLHRRDNLLALAIGVVRDLFFFVPGGRWVFRRLCQERELAADQLAITATRRPGALASGLVKAIDAHEPTVLCAGFAAPASVVVRVERLVTDGPRLTAMRTVAESALVALALTGAVLAAVRLPATATTFATSEGLGRDALAVLMTWSAAPAAEALEVDATVFDVWRRSEAYTPDRPAHALETLQDGQEFHPAFLRGEKVMAAVPRVSTVHSSPEVRVQRNEDLVKRWRATPVVAAEDGVGVYWLHQLERPH